MPHELVALRWSARCGMMIGCAAWTCLPRCDERVRVTAALPMSDRDKDAEILALRHQITVLERQPGKTRPQSCPGDRAFLAALPHRLPRDVLGRFRLLIRPETVLRWHRDLLVRRHAARSPPQAPGAAAHRPLRPPAGAAPGRRGPVLGVPAHPRRTARPRHQDRCLHRAGDTAAGRDRPGARALGS
jgi:hypothetical protein